METFFLSLSSAARGTYLEVFLHLYGHEQRKEFIASKSKQQSICVQTEDVVKKECYSQTDSQQDEKRQYSSESYKAYSLSASFMFVD